MNMAESTAIALLASSAVGAILGLISVTIVLVVVTKQLRRLVSVLRGEEGGSSVHMGLLSSAHTPPPPDPFVVPDRPMGAVGGADLRVNIRDTKSSEDAETGGSNGGSVGSASSSSNYDGKRGILKKPIARLPPLTKHEKKSRYPRTDENNTSCAIAEVDEEEDHTL
tara:strand:- start:1132 stop:1632 length:501 start_codon:yes stop_codon:yes gene_type:complete